MKSVVAQASESAVVDSAQLPPSALRVAQTRPAGPWKWTPRATDASAIAPIKDTHAAPVRYDFEIPKDAWLELEEFFEGIVDEIADDAVQLRTTSSLGEEGAAWLPIAKIPESERKYIELGCPIRISVLMRRDGTNRREHHIRVLRPSQWRPAESSEPAASYLLKQMKAVLRELPTG